MARAERGSTHSEQSPDHHHHDVKRIAKSGPVLPEPLANAKQKGAFTLQDVPTSEALASWLQERGIDTSKWGEGNTKTVHKYWKEIEGQEAGLELWEKANGEIQPVRVTHVLRAKVCSPSSYEKSVFLFNTWQQYGDGRKRIRNGLLSEKLTLDEMPLEDFLHEVCQRAVTEEEMQRVEDSVCTITADRAAPEFDPDYECPLNVVDETFVDHTVEIETSKSYPGLLTLYHLYTVDIICEGLPVVDFNTLEFEHYRGGNAYPKLKYIHAWVWLEWSQIQRYLFEGSSLKERKTKGSFSSANELRTWLGQFALDLDVWGTGTYRSVEDLFQEVDTEQTQLELWGRHDGVPLLMRVVHVIQLKIASSDSRNEGKFLFQVWQQSKSGQVRSVNRLVSKKLPTSNLPIDKQRFANAAKEAIQEQISIFVDSSFQLSPNKAISRNEYEAGDVKVLGVVFQGQHFDLEESPTYKGMHTMYHLYTMEVECEGLPLADFTTLDFKRTGGPYVTGWRWVNWQQSLDIVHERTASLERQDNVRRRNLQELSKALPRLTELTSNLAAQVGDSESRELTDLIKHLEEKIDAAQGASKCGNQAHVSLAKTLPPGMISKLAENSLVSEDFHDESVRIKETEKGQNCLIAARSVTFHRKHSALTDPHLAQFIDSLAAEEEPPATPQKSMRGSILPGLRSPSCTPRLSRTDTSSGIPEKGFLHQAKTLSALDDLVVQKAEIEGECLQISMTMPAFEGRKSACEVDESPQKKSGSGRGSTEQAAGFAELLKTSGVSEDVKERESTATDLALHSDLHVPSKMREAAQTAFVQSGIDTAGLVDRSVMVRIIDQICGQEPEYVANVEQLLDMVCPPQDCAGKVPCAAFLDYVFAD